MNTATIRHIILSLATLLASITATAQSFTLTGRVVDEENNPVELATVSCLEQGKVAATNLKGEFSMQLASRDRPRGRRSST